MARDRFETLHRDIGFLVAGLLKEDAPREMAKFARAELSKAIISGEASPIYDKFVNGRLGAEEETITLPGDILYMFSYWEPIINFALKLLREKSPRGPGRDGHYADSHVVMLGSQEISPATQISSDEEVTIVNTKPYSRKIEVGHMVMRVAGTDAVYAQCARAVKSQFGLAVNVRFKQILLPNGYVLKGVFRRGYKQFARTKLKKDTQAGARMTYPALILSMK